MIAPDINPVAFSIGPLKIHWYGLMYVLGFLSALLLAKYRARQSKSAWTPALCDDLLTYVALGVVVGGRLGYVLFYNFFYYLQHPLEIFFVWEGGMSFHGGFLGVSVALFLFAHKTKKHVIDLFDFVAPFVPQCILLGRIGNFINGELWGKVTDAPFGMVFKYAGSLPRHPSQLYEAVGEGLITFIIVWIFSNSPRKRGAIGGVFGLCYCIARFIAEFFREPDTHIGYLAFNWFTMGQLLTLGFALISIAFILYSHTQPIISWRD